MTTDDQTTPLERAAEFAQRGARPARTVRACLGRLAGVAVRARALA
jgi:hypothetical protein